MKDNIMFKSELLKIIEKTGFEQFDNEEISFIICQILGVKIKKINLKYLLEKGVSKKDALLFLASYELGKRDFFSFSQR